MKITVHRFASDANATLSLVKVDGRFVCFGLEDEYREFKVPGETRIPAGTYPIKLRTVGGFHADYAKRFASFHRGMLHVQNVPGFEYILIHCGNKETDTAGCLLVGLAAIDRSGAKTLLYSTEAYVDLYRKVIDPAKNGTLSITYIDEDLGK